MTLIILGIIIIFCILIYISVKKYFKVEINNNKIIKKMIKASELRKGNYAIRVFDSEKDPEGSEIIQVFGVNGNHSTYVCEDDNIGSLEELEPIPLTEDLLFKIKGLHKSFYHVFECVELGLEGSDFIEGWYSVRIGRMFIRKIKYLHELQNLYFSLTNKELEITL